MPTYDNNAVSKRILPIFILLAPVNSKTQSNLQQTLIDSLIKQLSELEDTVAKVSFLHIGHLAEKQQTGLVDSFVEIERPYSLNLDDAFSLLEQALSRKTMLRIISYGCYLPSFIFIGDCGQDLCQYTQRLQANDWFRRGRKMAIIYSKDSSAHFDSFCDLSECCFLCHSVDNCDNIIKSVTYIAGRTANPLSGFIVSCPGAQVDDSEDNLVQVDPVEPNNSDKDTGKTANPTAQHVAREAVILGNLTQE